MSHVIIVEGQGKGNGRSESKANLSEHFAFIGDEEM
jgi:hypothetical protein